MWIMLSDAMFSIVENDREKYDVDRDLVVRARRKGDIERVFGVEPSEVHESEDSDYRFRTFLSRQEVADVLAIEVLTIDYSNFKNSVLDADLREAYNKVWTALFSLQERLYPRAAGWWLNYRDVKQHRKGA